jgi:hypothetical protein
MLPLASIYYLALLCRIVIALALYNLWRGASGSVVGLKHYAISRKIEGSVPDEVIGFFN